MTDETIAWIWRLLEDGWSPREIGAELNLSHVAVRRVLRRGDGRAAPPAAPPTQELGECVDAGGELAGCLSNRVR